MTWEVASTSPHVDYIVLVELMLPTETVRAFNGLGTITWNSQQWRGAGSLGDVGAIESSADTIEAQEVRLSLSGIPSTMRSNLLNENARSSLCRIYHGFWDTPSGTFALDPELAYYGFIDPPEITEEIQDDDGTNISIAVSVISAGSYLKRMTLRRRTNADQVNIYAGDLFYSFKTDLRSPQSIPGAESARIPHRQNPFRYY